MSSLVRQEKTVQLYLPSGLTSSLQAGVILKEQDSGEAIATIAKLLDRLARLFQIPNWSNVASVDLAEWTFDNYRFESPELVIQTLTNPPIGHEKTWRLTPDTVSQWMAVALEKEAERREKAHEKIKTEGLLAEPSASILPPEQADKYLNEIKANIEKIAAPKRCEIDEEKKVQEREERRKEALLMMERAGTMGRPKFICDRIEVTAKDEHYAREAYKDTFGRYPKSVKKKEPESVTPAEPERQNNERVK